MGIPLLFGVAIYTVAAPPGILVERTTKLTMLRHLPPMAGYILEPPVKNGPGELAQHAQLKIHTNVAVKASGRHGPNETL